MLELSERPIRQYAAALHTGDIVLAEQDYRLMDLLRLIYSDEYLKTRLFLKGGTAINKLFLKDLSRLSVDLDFNVIGEKSEVFASRKKITAELSRLLKEQDNNYKLKSKYTYMMSTIRAKFKSVFGIQSQIKLEFAFTERFPVLKPTVHWLEINGQKFSFLGYRLEELLSTKIKALYARLKGRDLYDLYQISFKEFDKDAARKLAIYYFFRSRIIFAPQMIFENMLAKFKSEKFVNDISMFIRADVKFSIDAALEKITKEYNFLSKLDENDKEFIETAKAVLNRRQKTRLSGYPLRQLFEGVEISERARKITWNEIMPFEKRK